MNRKGEKKQKDRPISVISHPLNFEHRFHVGADGVNVHQLQELFENAAHGGNAVHIGKVMDSSATNAAREDRLPGRHTPLESEIDILATRNGHVSPVTFDSIPGHITPPPPCPSRDISGEHGYQSGGWTQQMKEELIPALRFEIDDLLDRKFAQLYPGIGSNGSHCSTCTCTYKQNKTAARDNRYTLENADKKRTLTNIHQSYMSDVLKDLVDKDDGGDATDASPRTNDADTKAHIIHNPVYPMEIERHVIQHTSQHTGTLMKYSSDIHLGPTKDVSLATLSLGTLERSNTLPGLKSPEVRALSRLRPSSKGSRPLIPDERECLAKALQTNVETIVDGVVFDKSELKEVLVEDGCLTEDERDTFIQLKDRKDQIRAILVLIKGRDLHVLNQFLKHLKKHNVSIYDKVLNSFDTNKKDGLQSPKCALCRLTTQVNVRYIIDPLWSAEIVDDGLYNLARCTDLPSGAQGVIWQKVIYAINVFFQLKRTKVTAVLKECLTKKKHYEHIAKALETDVKRHGQLDCRCEIFHQNIQTSYPASFASSVSPKTSVSGETMSSEDLRSDHSESSRRPGSYIQTDAIQEHDVATADSTNTVVVSAKNAIEKQMPNKPLEQENTVIALEDTSMKRPDEDTYLQATKTEQIADNGEDMQKRTDKPKADTIEQRPPVPKPARRTHIPKTKTTSEGLEASYV